MGHLFMRSITLSGTCARLKYRYANQTTMCCCFVKTIRSRSPHFANQISSSFHQRVTLSLRWNSDGSRLSCQHLLKSILSNLQK